MRRSSRSIDVHLTRRRLIQLGLATCGATLLGDGLAPRAARADGGVGELLPSPRVERFKLEMPVPPVLQPVAELPETGRCDFETEFEDPFPTKLYQVTMRQSSSEIIPGVLTKNLFTYEGLYPGPTFRARDNEPVLVRFTNALPGGTETSIHLHGSHSPAPSDGYPGDTFPPGTSRDYCYPNLPAGEDAAEAMSTAWYHDHAIDITGPNGYQGLAGFYLLTDPLEQDLIDKGVIPGPRSNGDGAEFDVPMVLQDKIVNSAPGPHFGDLVYDPFQHDGLLGDVFTVNGKAQPRFTVRRAKYRFRILNGSNARMYWLRLSTGQPFIQIAADSWLLPFAAQQDRILLAMAQRADVVIDFGNAPPGGQVFLYDVLRQESGRGPGGDLQNPDVLSPGIPLVRFDVLDEAPIDTAPRLRDRVPLRPNTRIEQVARTRVFEFVRSDGAWQINEQFFDPDRVDANPGLGTAERWILKNGGGGWWHPIHIHLESHQLQTFNGRPFLPQQPIQPDESFFKRDTTLLGPGDVAELFMKFRDFPGRFVMHCHNLEHEDDAMMVRFDVG